jgi:hypothetical protein
MTIMCYCLFSREEIANYAKVGGELATAIVSVNIYENKFGMI